jgi:hypothetical protein
VVCKNCGKVIKENDHCYQVRWGYCATNNWGEEEFIPEEDVAYFCTECVWNDETIEMEKEYGMFD